MNPVSEFVKGNVTITNPLIISKLKRSPEYKSQSENIHNSSRRQVKFFHPELSLIVDFLCS